MSEIRTDPESTATDSSHHESSDAEGVGDSGFAARVRTAVAWRYGGQVAAQVITWSSTILVVRLLDPSDYGLFAMSQVLVTALAFMNGYGFATSLIRTAEVARRDIAQVFGLLLLLNSGLAGTLLLLAPFAASYFREPQVAEILRVQIALFLVVPFIALPEAMLSRRLKFRPQAIASMAGAITGASVALVLAWLGWGVWALVYAPVLAFAARALALSIAAPVYTVPTFDFRGARAIITFGGALTLCQFFWIIQSQSDVLIAGRSFGTYELGLYSEALFVALIVSGRFLPPINEVAFPAYAELHHTGKRLGPYFLRVQRTVALVAFPLYVGLALTAHEAVATLFGEKWLDMAPLLQNLAIVMPFLALHIVCSPATNAMGRPRIYLTTSILGALFFAGCFFVGVQWGPEGLTWAWWVAAPALLAATLTLTLPVVGLAPLDLARALLPPAAASAAMAVAVSGVGPALAELAPWWRLAILVPAGGATYLATLVLVWPQVVRDSWTMLRAAREESPLQADPASEAAPSSAPARGDQRQTIAG
jgi:O-antigen/teichoic acid export membrane protein